MNEKFCRTCGEYKLIVEFSVRCIRKDGSKSYRSACKKCRKLSDSLYYQKNSEDIKEKVRNRYREKNPKSSSRVRDKCGECGKDLNKLNRYGSRLLCKDCGVIEKRKYDKSRQKRPYQKHGLTEKQYNHLFEIFDGKCHLCHNEKAKAIDHDHNCCSGVYSCGKCVRGLLCHKCNTGLGLFNDNEKTLEEALNYIKLYSHKRVEGENNE